MGQTDATSLAAGPSAGARGPEPEPLLLYSLNFYAELIAAIAGVTPSPDIVEVGSEAGATSPVLADLAAVRGGRLFVIEPYPSELLRVLAATRDNVEVIEGLSPQALRSVPRGGLYVLDGDHNYGVVMGELEEIFGSPGPLESLAFMHDVGWPCGRRDTYYAPDLLPEDVVHPHSFDRGALLDEAELAPVGQGFRSEGQYALAVHEGGARNGVLTAVEDFLAPRPDLTLLTSPLVFGVGLLGSNESACWQAAAEAFRPYSENPTLARMERNRIQLYLEVLRLSEEVLELRALKSRTLRARAGRVKHRFGMSNTAANAVAGSELGSGNTHD
jgi:hypothetical protein